MKAIFKTKEKDVEIDIAMNSLVDGIKTESHQKVINSVQKLRELGVKDIRFNFFEGQARYKLRKYISAKGASLESGQALFYNFQLLRPCPFCQG